MLLCDVFAILFVVTQRSLLSSFLSAVVVVWFAAVSVVDCYLLSFDLLLILLLSVACCLLLSCRQKKMRGNGT